MKCGEKRNGKIRLQLSKPFQEEWDNFRTNQDTATGMSPEAIGGHSLHFGLMEVEIVNRRASTLIGPDKAIYGLPCFQPHVAGSGVQRLSVGAWRHKEADRLGIFGSAN